MSGPLNSPGDRRNIDPEILEEEIRFLSSGKGLNELSPLERYWRDHKVWLEEKGYMLRPRYHPGWTPSWTNSGKAPKDCEDGQVSTQVRHLMDARRISDKALVMLKRISVSRNPRELNMFRLLHSESYRSDPHNHCVPVYEILEMPDDEDTVIIVMPFLSPWVFSPKLRTIGEAVEFLRQSFEGLKFLHAHRIAHNDVKADNIMMDPSPVYSKPRHPVRSTQTYNWNGRPAAKTRTERPVNYYYIDFDTTKPYELSEGQTAQEYPIYGGDHTVPEFLRPQEPCDPFAVDVYRLGNLVRETLSGGGPTKLNPTFRFLHPLIADMTQEDPTKRPSMDEALTRFETTVKKLSFLKLRSRLSYPDEPLVDRVVRFAIHWPRQVTYILRRLPAVPRPKA